VQRFCVLRILPSPDSRVRDFLLAGPFEFGQDLGRIGFWGVLERDLKLPSIWSLDFEISWWDKVTHMLGSSGFNFVT